VSLNNLIEPPAQIGVFTDAESISAITRFEGDLEALGYLDFTTSALPYHLLEDPHVLILGAGGRRAGAAGSLSPCAQDRRRRTQSPGARSRRPAIRRFAGGVYGRPDVETHLGEARSFVARTAERYDLIQIPLLYSFGAAAAGTQSLHESYVYTVEAFRGYLRKLTSGGMLSITLWLKLPPRDTLKLFATALEALRPKASPSRASTSR
jgi:hypothetical protein